MVSAYPIVWFREDTSGGWPRLTTKFGLNNLNFIGKNVPVSSSAVLEAIEELVTSCKAEDEEADVSYIHKKPLTFTKLVQAMEAKGLLKPTKPSNTLPKQSDEEASVSAAYKADVCN